MIFLEPEVDYFRMQLHHLALPRDICLPGSAKKSCSLETSVEEGPTPAPPASGKTKDVSTGSLSTEEKAEVLHRALLTALHQRFPYECPDTLEHVYILSITHLSSPPLSDTRLSCEELAELQDPQSFLPPELRFRTFPSHLNALLSSNAFPTGVATRREGEEKPQGGVGGKKEEDHLTKYHYNDTYFILLPELTRAQQQLYHQRRRDYKRTSYIRAELGGISPSDIASSEAFEWNEATTSLGEDGVKVGESMMGFRVLDGSMIYNMAATQTTTRGSASRSLQFTAFKVPLSRFSPEEQQYYTNKREEARFCAGLYPTVHQSKLSANSADNYMNDTMRRMLAFEVPERYSTEEDTAMESFFSRCNKILRYYAMPAGVRDKTANEEKETKSHAATTFELRESYASTSSFSSALGVRRLVYSFAPCDCYHLVTDENNPLYYAKSSRAAYDARTVSITLVSDLTAAPWSSPTISISSHPNAGTPNERGGKTTAGGGSGGLEGLVFSNQASRAASPDPIVSGKKSSTCTGRSLSPQPIRPQNGKRLSGARTSLQQLTSKTDGFLTLTTSLSCNNVSGNPKHRKDSLLEKGLFGGKEHEESKETDASNGVSNRSKHALSKGDFANIFCLLSNSSAAQHQLRHGVIRPVVSVAVLDREKRPLTSFLKGDNSDGIMCHGLLDHTWYSIPVQPLPAMQDDVQWMPVVFGSTECISDVGYRTAMQIGFFPNKTDTTTRNFSNQQMTSGVLPTLEEARRSLAAAQEKKSALAPRDPNLLPAKQQNKQWLDEVALSSVFKKETPLANNEQPANVTARRGGVAMTFGNDEQPASVTARRGGVAMTFGNDEQPANVTARRGGVAMTFGNDEQPANVTARRGEFNERDRMYGRKTGLECFGGDFDWRRSASYRSPKAQRPTIFERGGFALGEPEPAVTNENKISTFFSSTARPCMKNISPRPFCRATGMAPPEDICGGTPAGRWRASSPGPTFGESGAGQVLRNGGDWRPNAQRRGAAREDSPVPGFTGLPRSRATTVLDPFGKLCNRPSPYPTVDAPFQQMAGESHFYPSQNDRWQSHDVNNGVHRTGIAEHRGGSFWRPSSFGGPPPNGTSDPLASPISSISRSGLLMYEDKNAPARGGFGGNFTPDAFHRFSHRPTVGRLNTGIGGGRYDTTSVNHPSNSAGAFADSGKRVGAGINSSFKSPFARTGFLYDNGVSRLPIIDEYGSPRNGSRVRPRGMQAMDIAWSGQWASSPAPSRSAHDIPGRRAVPYPVTSRVASIAMPWRNTTTTGTGVNKRGLLASKPPLAPSSRAPPFCFSAKPAGVRGTVTPSSVRGLTLRERVRLRQQQLRREANLQAVNENLHENYCMGNDMKRLRKEPNGFISEKACPAINASGEPNVVTGNTTSVPGATAEPAHNGDTKTAEKQGAASLGSYGEQVRRLESLTEPFIQADGVNVSFCLRDLANVFLCLPGGALKENDLTKAAWLDDGVSYFVSAKPTRFRGGWESYLQHLNLYQQPFYLRERAFIFVLRVPYHPNLRVCVAVHNLDDFIALLQQRPLKPILLTKEEKWMQERLYGTDSGGIGFQAQTNCKRVGFFTRLFQRLHITKIDGRKEETRDEAQQCGGWAPMTWRRRLALLRLHAEATLRGSAWKTFTTPLLTDPALLQARMSFLSNRTATYAALRHRLNTLQALAATMVTKQREGCAREQPRMIENRVGSEKSLPLASKQTNPLDERPLFPLEARTPATTTTASGAKNVKTKREPFRVDRVGDGSATALRRPHPAPPAMQPVETSAAATTRGVIEKRTEMQTKCGSTLAPYASSVSLSRPQSPTPASQSDPVGVPGQLLPRETKRDALIQVAENLARRNNFPNEISPPPMTTVLKFVSSLDQTEKQGQIFDGCSKQTSISCVTTPNPVFAGLLPTPTEIHRQGECFNISVSQLQQLLQWQWEYHQNCYEAFPLPVFCGALVTPTAAYFDLAGGLKKRNEGSGVSPLSRSLLLALIKWGWLVPMDYKASREGTRLCFISEDPLSSLFGLQSRMGRGTFCLCFLVFGMWRHQAMWLALLYIVYNLLQAVMRVIFGGFHRRPAALDSVTSIAYLQSEAAVETMLEKRQFFRTQSLATRILRTQSFVQNVLSRAVMLMRGHSPFLSLIIGLEVLMTCLLLLIYKYSVCHLLPNTHLVPGVMVEHLLQALGPVAWVWNSAVVRWCAPLILPSDVDVKTLGFLFILYFFCFLLPWSPLRWMCRRTWELFLHDDALARRPLLSF